MLIILAVIILVPVTVHAMSTGNVAATVFYCFCLHWLRDCFIVVEEGDVDDTER